MDMMYIKYSGLKRKSIIKDGENVTESEVLLSEKKSSSCLSSSIVDLNTYKISKENNLNREISNYFFSEIHKNYLKNR